LVGGLSTQVSKQRLRIVMVEESRGEQLLQTYTLIGQEVQLPSSDWT